MRGRAKQVKRMVGVLQQLHRVEEFKKVELQHRLNELEHSQHEVILALNTDDALHGLFVDTTAKFLRSLSKEAQAVSAAKDVQTQRVLENASKVKHAERLHETLGREVRKVESDQLLEEAIERSTQRGGTSQP